MNSDSVYWRHLPSSTTLTHWRWLWLRPKSWWQSISPILRGWTPSSNYWLNRRILTWNPLRRKSTLKFMECQQKYLKRVSFPSYLRYSMYSRRSYRLNQQPCMSTMQSQWGRWPIISWKTQMIHSITSPRYSRWSSLASIMVAPSSQQEEPSVCPRSSRMHLMKPYLRWWKMCVWALRMCWPLPLSNPTHKYWKVWYP